MRIARPKMRRNQPAPFSRYSASNHIANSLAAFLVTVELRPLKRVRVAPNGTEAARDFFRTYMLTGLKNTHIYTQEMEVLPHSRAESSTARGKRENRHSRADGQAGRQTDNPFHLHAEPGHCNVVRVFH